MPDAEIDRIYDYDPKYLADILKSVNTIAWFACRMHSATLVRLWIGALVF